jgi:hypothetical protein
LQPAVVKVLAADAAGMPKTQGTGFFVSPNGLLVLAACPASKRQRSRNASFKKKYRSVVGLGCYRARAFDHMPVC